ncbi:MAG: hypothetical protein LBD29_01560 [Treponema sp.]|jgi:hypothetical protein|nr:hypothetical protein [Treponema sp.]
MAIQPLDLQTLFTQLDKVGKLQAAQKDGLAIQQSLQNVQIQKKTEEQVHSVEEPKQTGDGAEAVNDRNARKKSGGQSQNKGETGKKEAPAQEQSKSAGIFRDPSLGKNIDISG